MGLIAQWQAGVLAETGAGGVACQPGRMPEDQGALVCGPLCLSRASVWCSVLLSHVFRSPIPEPTRAPESPPLLFITVDMSLGRI